MDNNVVFNHKKVLSKIKSKKKEVNILVVDKECDDYYEENKMAINGSISSVLYCSSENVLSLVEEVGKKQREGGKPLLESMAGVVNQNHSRKKVERSSEEGNRESWKKLNVRETSTSHIDVAESNLQTDDLNLNMSAKEMRERLSKNKKVDDRMNVTLDVKKRVKAIQEL